jgi:hypothetical protein
MKNTKKLLSFSLSILLLFSFISIIPLNVNAETGNKDKVMKYLKTGKYEIWLIDKNNNNKIKEGSDPPVLENTEDDYVETVGYLGDKNVSTINDIIKSYNYTYPEDKITRTIPTKSIGHDTFRDCINLQKIEFPSTLDKIGYGAFHGCTALKEITIPNTVTAIGNFAFSDCKSLNKITFSSTLKSIGEFAFAECDSLINVTLPNSVTFIDDFAFAQCDNLTNVDLGTGKKTIGWLILDGSPKAVNVKNNNSSVKMRTSSAPAFNFESIEIPRIDGDANLDGEVNISDATTAQKYIAKISNEISKKADFNNDGVVNVLDVTAIQKSVAKIN